MNKNQLQRYNELLALEEAIRPFRDRYFRLRDEKGRDDPETIDARDAYYLHPGTNSNPLDYARHIQTYGEEVKGSNLDWHIAYFRVSVRELLQEGALAAVRLQTLYDAEHGKLSPLRLAAIQQCEDQITGFNQRIREKRDALGMLLNDQEKAIQMVEELYLAVGKEVIGDSVSTEDLSKLGHPSGFQRLRQLTTA